MTDERPNSTGWRVLQVVGLATRGVLWGLTIVSLGIGVAGLLWIRSEPKYENLMVIAVYLFVVLPAFAIGGMVLLTLLFGGTAGVISKRLPRPWGTRPCTPKRDGYTDHDTAGEPREDRPA